MSRSRPPRPAGRARDRRPRARRDPAPEPSSDRIRAHFDRLAAHWGDDVRATDWASRHSQEARFRTLLELGEFAGARVLDVGCGRGDFLGFLTARGIAVEYTGLDLSPAIVRVARRRHPGVRFVVGDVLTTALPRADYVVGSGIHHLASGDNDARVRRVLRRMWDLAASGVGTNMLSTDRPAAIELASHAYAYSPAAMEAFARTLTPHVRLRRGYLPHDFTLLLRRDEDFARPRG